MRQVLGIVFIPNEEAAMIRLFHTVEAYGFTETFEAMPTWQGGWICNGVVNHAEILCAPSYGPHVMTQIPVYN